MHGLCTLWWTGAEAGGFRVSLGSLGVLVSKPNQINNNPQTKSSFLFCFTVLGLEAKNPGTLGKCSTTEVHPRRQQATPYRLLTSTSGGYKYNTDKCFSSSPCSRPVLQLFSISKIRKAFN